MLGRGQRTCLNIPFIFQMDVCCVCGTFLPPSVQLPSGAIRKAAFNKHPTIRCKCSVCPDGGKIEEIMVPYVYKYLIAELGSVNLRICIKPASV